MKLELLAPAKNLEYGKQAINHGADALYIGAPAFGARAAATNTIDDIESLVNYAHLYGCKVFVTLNTVLFDHEMDQAVKMAHQLYDVGTDALIIQDMGLLECDLPPIELHASTQCHNVDAERISFLQSVGFKRVILARETSLEAMRYIRAATTLDLEAFVHGALCVCYSGQCYMSQYLNQRSGNRGCCSQPCRSSYDLYNGNGELLVKDRHLLSLRDFNASQHIGSMVDAGITSFKIEGRLKDLGYVKNVTAYYRRLLDGVMSGHQQASSGRVVFFFEPDVSKTFNRGYTDYFLEKRKPIASFDTPKSLGKYVGRVVSAGARDIMLDTDADFSNGDGLCFIDNNGRMKGFLVNAVDGCTVVPNQMPDIKVGTKVWRNNDKKFEKLLDGDTAERKVSVDMTFRIVDNGYSLQLTDSDGISAIYIAESAHNKANNPLRVHEIIVGQLSKLGGTPFVSEKVNDLTEGSYFLSSAMLNDMRRKAVEMLTEHRISHFRPAETYRNDADVRYPYPAVDYRANVVNSKAEQFYNRHGTNVIEWGVEQTGEFKGKALMTTKYCLRYELNCCLQGKSKGSPQVAIDDTDRLYLENNGRRFSLTFDCRQCQMQVCVDE